MLNITNNEMYFILSIFKNPEKEYNANSIAKQIGISSMGALKIAKKLEKENIIISRKLGKAKFFKINFNNNYVKQYLGFLLKREAEQASSYVKVWIREIRKLKSADVAILFGSVLQKQKDAGDVDVLLITNQKKFTKLKKEIESLDIINVKKLHPLYQTKEDVVKNVKKEDKPLLNAIKGIVVLGDDVIIKLFEKLK
ncbi:MAG: hypothetical protein J4472_03425 [DPANN group archaeon]|nr:hypothetical protein [DPANN group archaeon]